jgi:mRNA interferase HigB
MQLIGKELLASFKNNHSEARPQVDAWEAEVESADWKTPYDLKRRYPKASLPGNRQAIFDICRNKYRLWVKIAYNTGVVLVKAIGTHKEYENWNIE